MTDLKFKFYLAIWNRIVANFDSSSSSNMFNFISLKNKTNSITFFDVIIDVHFYI